MFCLSMYGVGYSALKCPPKGRTKQSMRDECDVNLIMANFAKTGLLTHLAAGAPTYADVGDMGDYRSALEQIRSVELYFADLPAKVRASFGNDALAFMEYLESGASEEDLRALSLEVLGDRRGRAQDAREGDEAVPDVVPAPEVAPEPGGTLPT